MLLEFSVENFRSIREKQTLSMIAAPTNKEHFDTHVINTGIRGAVSVLKSAVIYGANASGKSNLILAMNYMRSVVAESASIKPGHKFNMKPFLLNESSASHEVPTSYEVSFIVNDVRYQYGFSMNLDRILEEWLLAYPSPKPQTWFYRKYDLQTEEYVYEFSSYFTGQKKLWLESTRENVLFLSIATQLNSEQLTPIFNWLANDLVVSSSGGFTSFDFTTSLLDDVSKKKSIQNFLVSADISISDISTVQRKGFRQTINLNSDGKVDSSAAEHEMLLPQFTHKTASGTATFELGDESFGTQKLFSLAGPLLDILEKGRVFVVDELHNSLHPLLVKHLVEVFHNKDTNPHNAQLIFSTHDTSLLNSKTFRRDQIWFVEKDKDQATELFPLTDFSPRKGEALEKGYLSGRYGALPFFDDTLSW
ncbi:ATP-binding protein [Mariprofundus erugo]|uniref:ATP-binding protein n=1 Tax=Mariprofundus erugo TaxID=2528639 RepID=A0A5R9GUB5_9PROT|nr:ATP-binding protein [Mariprofundus erugo]TLS66784.1 ATP-binding protein [Mariprofundus erugo]TLS75343.1 ATP-binding protein [Mariprofundus erugo]